MGGFFLVKGMARKIVHAYNWQSLQMQVLQMQPSRNPTICMRLTPEKLGKHWKYGGICRVS